MSGKASSEGTKVTMGKNAPVNQEGAGQVSGSLAAESMARGGGFSENPGATTGAATSAAAKSESETTATKQSGGENKTSLPAEQTDNLQSATSVLGASGGQGGPAPTYIASQYFEDTAGPHGKNLKEGIDYEGTESGMKKALNAEPGSEDDPARVAERQFQHSQLLAAGGTGPRQHHAGDETIYDHLEVNEQA